MIAVDYTQRIDPDMLLAARVTDVFRYLCYTPKGDWKILRTAEYEELLSAGLGVTLNWEYDARDWMGGEPRGIAHGVEAAKQAHALGYPAGCTIFGSCDFDMTLTEWNKFGKFYARGFHDALGAHGYTAGVYGPYDVLGWCAQEGYNRFWQAGMSTAWSAGRNARQFVGAQIRQRRHMTIGGVDTDVNDILTPDWGQHRKGHTMPATDAQGNTFGQMGPPPTTDYYKTRGPGVALEDIRSQIIDGFSSYDGGTKGYLVKALDAIKNAVDVPGSVALMPEDRELLNRLADSLTASSVMTDEDRELLREHHKAMTAFTALFK